MPWYRPPDRETGTRLSVTVIDEEPGAGIHVEIGAESFEGELAGEPDERPAVLILDREAMLNGATIEALRLPTGVDDAVTQAVRVFGDC